MASLIKRPADTSSDTPPSLSGVPPGWTAEYAARAAGLQAAGLAAGAPAAGAKAAADSVEQPAEEMDTGPRLARLAVGLASLAAEQLRVSERADETLAAAVGLVERAAAQSRIVAQRWRTSRAVRLARFGATVVGYLPGASELRDRVTRLARDVRRRGNVAVATGRDEALDLIKSTVDRGIAWARDKAVPRVLDGIVPQLVNDVVPRVVDELRRRELDGERERIESAVRHVLSHRHSDAAGPDTGA